MGKQVKIEQADGSSSRKGGYHASLKKVKNRVERRRAKYDPECLPAYRRYRGYET